MSMEIESYDIRTQWDGDSIVEKFRAFRDRSKKQFADNYTQMDNDRDFLVGDTQWSKSDDIKDDRNRLIVNVISNTVNAVVNQYSAFPFVWYTGEQEDDRMLDAFAKRGSNGICGSEALRNSASVGATLCKLLSSLA